MEKYEYPEVYVEDVDGDCYIVFDGVEYRFSSEKKGVKSYGHILYEDVIDKAIDLVNGKTTREIIVIPRFKKSQEIEALYVDKGVNICLMEIKAYQPYVFVSEGDVVEERDKIAYMVTGKGEVRVYKSVCRGIVFLVVNIPWERPEKYILVVVNEDDVRRITIKRS